MLEVKQGQSSEHMKIHLQMEKNSGCSGSVSTERKGSANRFGQSSTCFSAYHFCFRSVLSKTGSSHGFIQTHLGV